MGASCALAASLTFALQNKQRENVMNRIIYIVGLIVVIIAVLSFFGLR